MSIKIYEAYRLRRGVDLFGLLWEVKREAQRRIQERLKKIFMDVLQGRSHTAYLQLKEQEGLFKAWVHDKHKENSEKAYTLGLYTKWVEEECPPEFRVEEGVFPVSNEEVLKVARPEGNWTEGIHPGVFDIDAWALAKYGEQLNHFQRNPWALDVCVTARRCRDRFYLIPYCERTSLLTGCLNFMENDERLDDFSYWNNSDRPEEVTSQDWTWRATVWNELTVPERWAEFLVLDILSWHGWSEVSPMIEIAQEQQEGNAW